MCNTPRYSESGACLGVQRCEEYEALRQERDALLKVREAADVLVEVADTIRMIHLGDGRSGLKVAIDVYKESRNGRV